MYAMYLQCTYVYIIHYVYFMKTITKYIFSNNFMNSNQSYQFLMDIEQI